ncbi:hypothetical protein C8046_02055 [Serinibacter arcticus]|uniref:Uncharacterized protein n=1 Tax=Serinibacter arcticus TaxID=1655435 RepID=A0A2U1ZRQ8_9MICO|nr:hypothetical protein [Serinibacter arcticus]PWD49674.1 hypothetical protein C8046_02055 [Serinibacter arcticus]
MLTWLLGKLSRDPQIDGELAQLLTIIGTRADSPEMASVRPLLGSSVRVSDDGNGEVYDDSGLLLTYVEGRVRSLMLRTQPFEDRVLYPRPDALVVGLSPRATEAELAEVLGKPWDSEGTTATTRSTVGPFSSSCSTGPWRRSSRPRSERRERGARRDRRPLRARAVGRSRGVRRGRQP